MADTKFQYEVGGILLGYQILQRCYVVAVTFPTETGEKSKVSFVLDGEQHTAHISEIMQKFCYAPSVLGVWHSHICDIPVFSEQDRDSNKQLAVALDGTLSTIATLSMPMQQLNLTTYFVTAKGKEYLCKTIVDLHDCKIPYRFIKHR